MRKLTGKRIKALLKNMNPKKRRGGTKHIHVDSEGQVVATDGNALIVLKGYAPEGKAAYNLHREPIETMEAKDTLNLFSDEKTIERYIGCRPALDCIDQHNTPFPQYPDVIPQPKETDYLISLNPKRLVAMAAALGTVAVTLRINLDDRGVPMIVTPCEGEDKETGSFGVTLQSLPPK